MNVRIVHQTLRIYKMKNVMLLHEDFVVQKTAKLDLSIWI